MKVGAGTFVNLSKIRAGGGAGTGLQERDPAWLLGPTWGKENYKGYRRVDEVLGGGNADSKKGKRGKEGCLKGTHSPLDWEETT